MHLLPLHYLNIKLINVVTYADHSFKINTCFFPFVRVGKISHACSCFDELFKRGMIAQRNQRDHLLFCFSICRFDCIACDSLFVINNGHFLNWQNVYLVGNQLQFTSLNGTHILPCLCNPKLLFALFNNLKCLSSRQVNKCKRKKNPLNVYNSIYL